MDQVRGLERKDRERTEERAEGQEVNAKLSEIIVHGKRKQWITQNSEGRRNPK